MAVDVAAERVLWTSIANVGAAPAMAQKHQVLTLRNTLLGDGEMEKLVMCRMNQDFMVFMRKNYPQVADEQFEFWILKAEDIEEKDDD